MNLVLLLVCVLEMCVGVCAWLSPWCLRSVAAHLLTRADLLDLIRKEEQRRIRYWEKELGLATHPEKEIAAGAQELRVLARH
jgi:hypothetical protein